MGGVEELCNCGFSRQSISDDAFQCFSADAVTYRGMLHGTEQASSLQLAGFIEQWTAGEQVIPVQGVFLTVDSSCSVIIESTNDSECAKRPSQSSSPTVAAIVAAAAVSGGLIVAIAIVLTLVTCLCIRNWRTKALLQ